MTVAKWLAIVACYIAGIALRPLVLVDGWAWFVVPLGAQQLTYWPAFGLLSLASFAMLKRPASLTEEQAAKRLTDAERLGRSAVHGVTFVLTPLVSWAILAAVHSQVAP